MEKHRLVELRAACRVACDARQLMELGTRNNFNLACDLAAMERLLEAHLRMGK